MSRFFIKKSNGSLLLVLMSMGVTVLLLSIFVEVSNRPVPIHIAAQEERAVASTVVNKDSNRYGNPVRLTIDKINVDADIQLMGLTPDDDMESPTTNEHAGWYKYGARPGNSGSAVMAGHLGLENDAVFGQLALLEKGDIVNVTDDRDQTVSFVVSEKRLYSSDAAPSEVFTSTSGSHLNLITCEGDWDTEQNTYAERLVVFTTKR